MFAFFPPRRNAFTLVELMVVVTIIAMLIMLVTPQLHNARTRARSVKCQNNLRQYGVAVNQYISDWSGYFIMPAVAAGGSGTMKGTAVEDNPVFDMSPYRGGAYVGTETPLGGSAYHSLSYFIPTYISTNYTAGSMNHCPEADFDDIFATNSRYYKGEAEHEYSSGLVVDYEDNWGKMTTYGINMTYDSAERHYVAYNQLRNGIPDKTIAFCDWNASEGWMSESAVSFVTSRWFMMKSTTGPAVRPFYANCNDDASHPSKELPGFLTEIGYRHHISKDWYANYVCFDGHVGAVALPEVIREYLHKETKLKEVDLRQGHIGLALWRQYANKTPTMYLSDSVVSNFHLLFFGY